MLIPFKQTIAAYRTTTTASIMAMAPMKERAVTAAPPPVAMVADGEAGVMIAPVDTVALLPGLVAVGAIIVINTSVLEEPGATETTVVTKVNGTETGPVPDTDVAKIELETGGETGTTLAAATEVALDVNTVVETAYMVVETLAGQLVMEEPHEVTVISSVV